jgi:hypothetical protein
MGSEMLVADVDPAGVPPVPNLAHGRQQHLVDGAVESQHLPCEVQGPSDALRRQIASTLKERLDQRAR